MEKGQCFILFQPTDTGRDPWQTGRLSSRMDRTLPRPRRHHCLLLHTDHSPSSDWCPTPRDKDAGGWILWSFTDKQCQTFVELGWIYSWYVWALQRVFRQHVVLSDCYRWLTCLKWNCLDLHWKHQLMWMLCHISSLTAVRLDMVCNSWHRNHWH